MEFLERVLRDRAEYFAQALTEVGFSEEEAARFLLEAGPALLQSYQWLTERRDYAPVFADVTSEVLAGIRGRTLSTRTRLPLDRTWAGLRELVPAVLEATRLQRAASLDARSRAPELSLENGVEPPSLFIRLRPHAP